MTRDKPTLIIDFVNFSGGPSCPRRVFYIFWGLNAVIWPQFYYSQKRIFCWKLQRMTHKWLPISNSYIYLLYHQILIIVTSKCFIVKLLINFIVSFFSNLEFRSFSIFRASASQNFILFYFTILKNYFITYIIPFYNTSNIPKFYFTIQHIKIIFLRNKIIYSKPKSKQSERESQKMGNKQIL